MKYISTIFIFLLVVASSISVLSQDTLYLSPLYDVNVGFHDNFNSANTNYSTASHFGAFSQPGAQGGENAARSLIKFDLSAITECDTLIGAYLNLYGRGPINSTGDATSVGNIGTNDCYIQRIVSSWNPFTVTWNTQPTYDNTSNDYLPTSNQISEDFLNIDITNTIKNIVASNSNNGFVTKLVTEAPTRGLFFCSSDFPDSTKHPVLMLIISTQSSDTTTLSPLMDANVGFHDNYNTANNNYGTASHFGAFSQPGAQGGENAARSLIKFDLSTFTASEIKGAYLDLYGRGPINSSGDATSVGNIGNNDCYIRRITSNWMDNTVTWNTQPTYDITNNIYLPQSTQISEDYLNVDVTSIIIDILNSGTNNGFATNLVTEAPTRGLFFCSSDFPDSTKHPRLRIITCKRGNAEPPLNISQRIIDVPNPLVYPNPSNGKFNLVLNEYDNETNFTVFDNLGKLILFEKNVTNINEIDLSYSPKGIYIIRIVNQNKVFTKKIIVE